MPSRLDSIEWKLPALITAVIAVAVVALLWSARVRLTDVVTHASGERLLSSARLVAGMLDDGNPVTAARLTAIARSAHVMRAFSSPGGAAAVAALSAPVAGDSMVVGRWLLDPGGTVRLTSTGAGPHALWWGSELRAARPPPDRLAFSPILDDAGTPVFEVILPVYASGNAPAARPVGYVVEVRIARGRGVEAVRSLAGTRTLLIGQPGAGVWTDLEVVAPAPPTGFTRDSIAVFAESPRGPGVGASATIAGTPWVVWVQSPRDEVMRPVQAWIARTVPLALAVLLASALVAWLTSRGMTGRLASLTRRMERLDLGEQADADPVLVARPDEVGRLEVAFQRLLERARSHKRLEAQLLEAQKLEAVGRLAGGIAHDFNNMLTVVTNYGAMVRAELPAGTTVAKDMDEVLRASEGAARLTRQLLTFSGRRVVAPRSLDLNAIIREAQRMLERLIPERIRFTWDLDPGIGPIRADQGQLEQVLLNLVLNAADAMPDGGEIEVRTTRAGLDDPPSAGGAGGEPVMRDRPHVCLAVRDTGTGMDRETVARIFEPFFTTKAPGKGTGLGLATVHGIVTQLRGRIWVYSEPGRGTTFKLYFPEERGEAEALASRTDLEAPLRASGTVLLVEDDPSLREVTRRLLERDGFTVIPAADAGAALDELAHAGDRVSMVLSDVVMPGMSGAELAARLGRERPALPVVLMSGYNEIAPGGWAEGPSAPILLEKPFAVSALRDAMRRALSARPPGSAPPPAAPR